MATTAATAASEGNSAALLGDDNLPVPQILLRCPGKLQLFRGPSREETNDEGLKNDLTAAEKGLPELDASMSEWSK